MAGPVEVHRLAEVLDGRQEAVLERGTLVLIEGAPAGDGDAPGALGWLDGRSTPGRHWVLRVAGPRFDEDRSAVEHRGSEEGSAPITALRSIELDPETLTSRFELDIRRWTWIVHDGDGRVDLELVLDELTPRHPAGKAPANERFRSELRVIGHSASAVAIAVDVHERACPTPHPARKPTAHVPYATTESADVTSSITAA